MTHLFRLGATSTGRSCATPLAGPALAQEPKANARGAVVDGLMALAKAKYGQHLSAEQLEQVKQSLQRDLYGIELLHQVPLKNGDEPSFVFRADLP